MTVPSVKAEIAFTGSIGTGLLFLDDTVRGKLDTAKLAGDEPWTDVSAYVRSGSTQRGSTRVDSPILRYETGTASLTLDNRDRRFDPTNLSGPYVAGGVTLVKARRAARILASHGGTTYEIYRGFTGNFDVQWNDLSDSDSTTVVPMNDAFAIFAGDSRTAVASTGAGEDTGARVDRILDSLDWPADDRSIASGNTTVQATTLDGNGLDELQLTADTELGELYMDKSGRVVFRNRLGILTDSRSSTSQATFSDNPGVGEYPYHGLGLSTDDATLANHVKITRVGGTIQEATDSTSIGENFRKTFERSDLIMDGDTDALGVAQWLVHISKDPELRFTELKILIHHDPDTLVPVVFPREVGDRITIIRNPPGGGDAIERDVFIRGIRHDFTPSTWEVTFTLQSAVKGSFFVLNSATLGTLDNNALAY